MKPILFRTMLATAVVSTGVIGCSSAQEESSIETPSNPTVAEQLADKGFVLDAARPARTIEDALKPVTVFAYRHPDGRVAMLVREEGSLAEKGMIFDEKTRQPLEELAPYAGKMKAGAVTPANSGCSSMWNDWSWTGYVQWSSTCDGETGALCSYTVYFYDYANKNYRNCQTVSCACGS